MRLEPLHQQPDWELLSTTETEEAIEAGESKDNATANPNVAAFPRTPQASAAVHQAVDSRGWRPALLALAVSLGCLLTLYGETAVSMVAIWWRSETFAHGMLIAPIALYMIWIRRTEIAYRTPRCEPLGLTGLLLLGCVWLVARTADVLVLQQFALVAMIPTLVYTLLGSQVIWALAFPLAYLFFMVPFGEGLVAPLQDFTALFTVEALRLTDIPVYWEGRFITIPTGKFEVAEACSGLRYLIASLALGCLYAYLNYRTLWRRLLFIALAMVVPVLANGVRAYGIVMIAHLSDMRLAVGVDHLIYGWIFFGVVILLLFWLGSFWREVEPVTPPAPVAGEPARGHQSAAKLWATAAAGILVLALAPAAVAWMGGAVPPAPAVLTAPVATPPWRGPAVAEGDRAADRWMPQFQGASAILHKRYWLDEQPVHLYIAYYHQQQQGAELINSRNTLYDSEHWFYLSKSDVTPAAAPHALTATQIGSGSRKQLIWHWYWVSGRTTTVPGIVKLLEGFDRLRGAWQGSALVAVAAEVDIFPEKAEMLLLDFLKAHAPAIQAALEAAGS